MDRGKASIWMWRGNHREIKLFLSDDRKKVALFFTSAIVPCITLNRPFEFSQAVAKNKHVSQPEVCD